MIKNFYKVFIAILTFLFFLPNLNVSAHSPTKDPWLYINDIAITDEFENPVPNPSNLIWGEHIFPNDLKVDDSLGVSIDRDVIERDLNAEKKNIAVSYEFINPSNNKVDYNNDFKTTLTSTGNYFVKIKVIDSSTNRSLVTESLMVIVGESFESSKFTINNIDVDFELAIPIYYLEENFNVSFAVKNPSEKFDYTWDLGTGEKKSGDKLEHNYDKAKIPVYVTLRTTNKDTKVFVDSFVRLDTKKENIFTTPKPPVKVPEGGFVLPTNNNGLKLVLIFIMIIGLATFVGSVIYARKKK